MTKTIIKYENGNEIECEIEFPLKVKCINSGGYQIVLKKGNVYNARLIQKGWFGVVCEDGDESAFPPEMFEIIEWRHSTKQLPELNPEYIFKIQ